MTVAESRVVSFAGSYCDRSVSSLFAALVAVEPFEVAAFSPEIVKLLAIRERFVVD